MGACHRRCYATIRAVVRHGEGYLVDGRVRLGTFPDLVDFARARSIGVPDLSQAAE
jgi:hypothetical protein